MLFCWKRYDKSGYEVSSKGDKRFSAFNAKMLDGRSIEQHYQCDVKGYDPGGTNWRVGKGKPPIRECNLLDEYTNLWFDFAENNPILIQELYVLAKEHNYTLTDMFATTDVNQANALSIVLNKLYS